MRRRRRGRMLVTAADREYWLTNALLAVTAVIIVAFLFVRFHRMNDYEGYRTTIIVKGDIAMPRRVVTTAEREGSTGHAMEIADALDDLAEEMRDNVGGRQ